MVRKDDLLNSELIQRNLHLFLHEKGDIIKNY